MSDLDRLAAMKQHAAEVMAECKYVWRELDKEIDKRCAAEAERDALRARLAALGEPVTEYGWRLTGVMSDLRQEQRERTVYRSEWRPVTPASEGKT